MITPAGWPVARENVYWQCVSCWYIHSQNRQELKEEMLKQKVDQIWPS
ncbi:hypothetical protein SEA_ARGAN_73 [Arthrobacter phage Argan]|nr:hypothetical protein SEA_ARGAN_73 [Arthrobacter phage Argan]